MEYIVVGDRPEADERALPTRPADRLDRWSDLDVGFVLRKPVDLTAFTTSLGPIWALDRQPVSDPLSCRMVFDDGRHAAAALFDLDTRS